MLAATTIKPRWSRKAIPAVASLDSAQKAASTFIFSSLTFGGDQTELVIFNFLL
jgi:hypothetical protein